MSKANAQGIITDIEDVMGAINGYELTRGVAWRFAFTTKINMCETSTHCDTLFPGPYASQPRDHNDPPIGFKG